jgi:hypothetical protein
MDGQIGGEGRIALGRFEDVEVERPDARRFLRRGIVTQLDQRIAE